MVGIENVLPTVQSMLGNNRIRPLLISGDNGSGKTTFMQLIARSFICTNRTGIEACQACENCQSPDIEFGGFHAMSSSGTDLSNRQIKCINDNLYSVCMNRHFHVVIVDDFDHADASAFNKIIRLMNIYTEDLFIFTATKLGKLPPPLIQRCKHLTLNGYSPESLELLIRTVCKKENISIDSTLALGRLIEYTLRNPRSILNALEAVKDNNLNLSEDVFDVPSVSTILRTLENGQTCQIPTETI
ncbi:MAG: AAA family ATPase [Candidatus Marinimicrobia bacterium]|nr:AAA family ATPase [Candidatus Neomarinimicrobiota bacterium]